MTKRKHPKKSFGNFPFRNVSTRSRCASSQVQPVKIHLLLWFLNLFWNSKYVKEIWEKNSRDVRATHQAVSWNLLAIKLFTFNIFSKTLIEKFKGGIASDYFYAKPQILYFHAFVELAIKVIKFCEWSCKTTRLFSIWSCFWGSSCWGDELNLVMIIAIEKVHVESSWLKPRQHITPESILMGYSTERDFLFAVSKRSLIIHKSDDAFELLKQVSGICRLITYSLLLFTSPSYVCGFKLINFLIYYLTTSFILPWISIENVIIIK